MIFCAKWQNFGSGLSGLGVIDEKRFVMITDKVKRIISVCAGEKVYPIQLKSIMSKMLGVVKVFVVQAQNKEYGEYYISIVCIVIDSRYNSEQIIENILLTCEESLLEYV